MKPDIARKYPLAKKNLDEIRSMGLYDADTLKRQERAVELIAAEGGGSKEEKEASMICACLILQPMALYVNVGRFWEGYTEEVTNTVNNMLQTGPGSFLPPAFAQGTAAAGIVQMQDLSEKLSGGKPLGSPAADVLEAVKTAYGQEMEIFSYLEAPLLLGRYEKTREDVFAALDAQANPPAPPSPAPRRPKPGNGDFSF